MGHDLRENFKQYRTISEDNGLINKILKRMIYILMKKYILDLLEIVNFGKFNQQNEDFINQGEVIGLINLLKKDVKAINFNWFDTGNPLN